MLRLITIWLDLCLLRLGPQDLPASRVLLMLSLAAYVLISFALSLPGYPSAVAAQMAGVDMVLLVVFVTAPLYLLNKTARIGQTLTALAGSGALLGLLALPVIRVLFEGQDSGEVPPFAAMVWLILFGWSLLVVAHIMRHALSVAFAIGLGVAILYTLVAMQVIGTLFPAETN
ncbi:MAG: hypothetical protein ACC648_09720 [Thiohalobacterales bacterium]